MVVTHKQLLQEVWGPPHVEHTHYLRVYMKQLREKLDSPELAQLRQRITVSYHLRPLDPEETAAYVNHRLRRASIAAPLQFPAEVTRLVYERSRGVPRLINVICDAVLVFGYAAEQPAIDLALAREVMAELETTGVLMPVTAERRAAAEAAVQPAAAAPVRAGRSAGTGPGGRAGSARRRRAGRAGSPHLARRPGPRRGGYRLPRFAHQP